MKEKLEKSSKTAIKTHNELELKKRTRFDKEHK